MKICFYDVSRAQELCFLNGRTMSFAELLHHHRLGRTSCPDLILDSGKFLSFDFHPYGAGKHGWRNWGRYFATVVQLLSGHCPSKEEIQLAKGFVMSFDKETKKKIIDKHFVLCFLPYLFVGLKIHTGKGFTADSNRADDVKEFVVSLWGEQRVLMTSFLCSHRDPTVGPELNLLQTNIPEWKARRSVSMILAIMNNCRTLERGRLMLIQQGLSIHATSTVFPEITLEYIQKGDLHELLRIIQWQYNFMQDLLEGLNGGKVTLSLRSTDAMNHRLEKMMSERFGLDWRIQDYTVPGVARDPLVQIGLQHVLPSLRRLTTFFDGDTQAQFLSRVDEMVVLNRKDSLVCADLAENIIREFARNYTMNIGAKSVQEACFYYLWGKYSGLSSGAFSIGIDRDHDRYQCLAWALGCESTQAFDGGGQQQLLSARRNPNGSELGILADLSFRQFWR